MSRRSGSGRTEAPGCFTLTHIYSALEGVQPPAGTSSARSTFPGPTANAGWPHRRPSSLEELPAEAARDRESCRRMAASNRILTIPLSVGGEPAVGALGLNTRADAARLAGRHW